MPKRTSTAEGIGRRWLSPILMKSQPQCPHCGVPLEANTWMVHNNNATCKVCHDMRLRPSWDDVTMRIIGALGIVAGFHHGIKFFIATKKEVYGKSIPGLTANHDIAMDTVTQMHQRSTDASADRRYGSGEPV